MKTHIITAKIKVDDQDIAKASEWAKRRGFIYAKKGKANTSDMVFDYLTDGGHDIMVEETQIEEHEEI